MAFTEKQQAFLRELTELSRKHGIIITGCGCCGSPGMDDQDCSDPQAGYGTDGTSEIAWIIPGSYNWERSKGTIVGEA